MATAGNALRPSRYEDRILLVLTLIIGAVVGLVVVAFIVLTENLGSKLYPPGSAAWRRVIVPVAGALVSGFLLSKYFPNARGSGIPQTKTALFLRDGFISFRTVLGKFGLCSVSLASGIALGREGPSVHVGAGIASVLGRRLGLSPASVRALLPVGASAALAAAFNTPIAAVLFSLEEVMGDMHAPVLGSIVLSSATSWIVLHLVLGDEPLFHVPAYQLVHPVEFIIYAVLGVVLGIVSVGFVKLLLWQRKQFMGMPKSVQWLLPTVGGLTVGLLGWLHPEVLGVGYGFVSQALNGQMVIRTMALLVLLKIIATATCYASGNAGGIFGPSLFMGAMMGGTVGGIAHLLLPDYTGSVGAYALVGMGAAFAGVVRVPLTSVIMIFEITRDYSIIVPLMIANLVSYFISSRLQEEPIYEALQHQDGIHLPTGERAHEILLTVGHALRPAALVLASTDRVNQVAASLSGESSAWPVVDPNGLLRGMFTTKQLQETVTAHRDAQLLAELIPDPGPPEALSEEHFPHVHADHTLEVAMRRLAESKLPVLPVVSRTNVRELRGTVSVQDILAAYAVGAPREQAAPAGLRNSAKLLAGVTAVIVAVVLTIGFLNYYYRAERLSRAQKAFQAGNELLQKERYDEAVQQYRNALSITHSVEHRMALGLALEQEGHFDEAAIYLSEVLRANPSTGPANLGFARVEAQRGNLDSAIVHFQRAIYGTWPDKVEAHRFQARLELIHALVKAGRGTQAQAELMTSAAAAPQDPALEKQLGRLLIDNGLPKNAAELYGEVLRQNPRDAEASARLGDAEFTMGDYAAAREAYQQALQADPSDTVAAQRSGICERALALDPTLRGLSAAEKADRSRALLQAVVDRLAACGPPADMPGKTRTTADSLAVAEEMWTARAKSCVPPVASDDPVALVMAKIGR